MIGHQRPCVDRRYFSQTIHELVNLESHKKYIWIRILFLSFFLNLSIGQISWADIESRKAISEEVFEHICDKIAIDEDLWLKNFIFNYIKAIWVDLNNDGLREIFISGHNMIGYSGAGGWWSWLFQKKGARYELIQESFG